MAAPERPAPPQGLPPEDHTHLCVDEIVETIRGDMDLIEHLWTAHHMRCDDVKVQGLSRVAGELAEVAQAVRRMVP